MIDYIVLGTLWILWCCLHSYLVSSSFLNDITVSFAPWARYHRVLYNCGAVVTLLPILVFSFRFNDPVLFRWEGVLTVLQAGMLLVALLLFVSGGRNYDLLQFLGIRQIITGQSRRSLSADGKLKQSGVHGLTRHPWYLGALLLLWSCHRNFSLATLIVNTILSIYLVVGTFLEESKLKAEYGQSYEEYRARVSMLIPLKWMKTGLERFWKGPDK